MSEGTTQIFRRRVRHWKTTATGIATILAPIAAAAWPHYANIINDATMALVGAGLISAADAQKKDTP